MGAGAFRFADGDEEGAQGVCRFPEAYHGRRLHHVSVFHLSEALSQPGECRGSHQACEVVHARVWRHRHTMYYRQTVWRHGDIQQLQAEGC